MQEEKISISNEVENNQAMDLRYAIVIFQKISNFLKENVFLTLDFSNLTLITPDFFYIMFGQLYKDYNSRFLYEHIKIENLSDKDSLILKRVADNAELFFAYYA